MGVSFVVWFPTLVIFVATWESLRYLINKHGF